MEAPGTTQPARGVFARLRSQGELRVPKRPSSCPLIIVFKGRDGALPDLQERVGPDGSRHRMYPAPAEVSPPVNMDDGWGEPLDQRFSTMTVRDGTIDQSPASAVSYKHAEPNHYQQTRRQDDWPKTVDPAPASQSSTPSQGGSYVPWVGVT